MKIVCGWCKKDMGTKPPEEDTRITTSMCPDCQEEKRRDMREFRERGRRKDSGCRIQDS